MHVFIIWRIFSDPVTYNTVLQTSIQYYDSVLYPHFWIDFLLRSSVYSNMRPCVAALENAKWLVYKDWTSNSLISNSCKIKPSFMPHFGTNKQSSTASDRNHAHLIQLQSIHRGCPGNHAWIRQQSMAGRQVQCSKEREQNFALFTLSHVLHNIWFISQICSKDTLVYYQWKYILNCKCCTH